MSLALEENNVHRGSRFLSSLFLTAALATPMAMMAAAIPQDNQRHEDKQDHKRYYDKQHKDYHTWDDNEDRSYQRYQTEREARLHRAEHTPAGSLLDLAPQQSRR